MADRRYGENAMISPVSLTGGRIGINVDPGDLPPGFERLTGRIERVLTSKGGYHDLIIRT